MYIAIEGIDGCGKDTQADLLEKSLPDALRVTEPSTLPTGELLRTLLSDGKLKACYPGLFLADRMALQEALIRPALEAGKPVISTRCFMSSLVYQQERWSLDWLLDIHRELLVFPSHIVLLSLPVEVALERIQARGRAIDIFEREDLLSAAHGRYFALATTMASRFGVRVVVVDGGQPAKKIAMEIKESLDI